MLLPQPSLKPLKVRHGVAIGEDPFIDHVHIHGLFLLAAQNVTQTAPGIGGKLATNDIDGDERRMPSELQKSGINDACGMVKVGFHESPDGGFPDKRNIRREQKERPDIGFQSFHPGKDGRKHPLRVFRIENGPGPESSHERLDLFGFVSHHDPDILDTRTLEELDNSFQQGGRSQGKEGLEGPHARGVSGRQHQGTQLRGGIHRPFPARTWINSATILTAISSGVSPPMSKPMGEWTRLK